ncbi:MAG: metalloregulator ArsR/SmtB family transcription factor [Candidatus Portnoybacteria bacterium]
MPNKKTCPLCFHLLSEKTRAKIIKYLKKGAERVGKIQAKFALTQPTITHHLRVLEKGGMIVSKKQGREVYYSWNKKYPCKECTVFKMLSK